VEVVPVVEADPDLPVEEAVVDEPHADKRNKVSESGTLFV
jgi:hypothetical protein